MRTAIIVESRLSSRRLPGKALRPIGGEPMLGLLLDRLKRSRRADVICVATSTEPADQEIAALARAKGVESYRGSLDDVLGRVLGALDSVSADVIVEITGDCPLADPRIIDQAIERYLAGGADYVTNILGGYTYPIGMDVQVYSRSLLAGIDLLCTDPAVRVDVTPFIYWHGDRFRLLNLLAPPPLSRSGYRLCVDVLEDFEVIEAVHRALGGDGPAYGLAAINTFLDANPDLARHNLNQPDAFIAPRPKGPYRTEAMPMPPESKGTRV